MGLDEKFLSRIAIQAKKNPKRVVFTEADNYKILKAAQISIEEGTAVPILLGQRSKINQLIEENGLVFDNVQIIDPAEEHEKRKLYGERFYAMRQRKGMTYFDCHKVKPNFHLNY